jgi:hypothetical protein
LVKYVDAVPIHDIIDACVDGLDGMCRSKPNGRHQMPNLLDKLSWYEPDGATSQPSAPEELVDVGNAHAVLDFTYRYLEARLVPPSDDEVHNVTATIARYKGPPVVRWGTLELFLAGLLAVEPA